MDTDGNHEITKDEFIKGCLENKSLTVRLLNIYIDVEFLFLHNYLFQDFISPFDL